MSEKHLHRDDVGDIGRGVGYDSIAIYEATRVQGDFYRAVLEATPRVAAKCADLYAERMWDFVESRLVPPVGSIEERFGFRWDR